MAASGQAYKKTPAPFEGRRISVLEPQGSLRLLLFIQFIGEFGREAEDVFVGSATLKHSTQQLRSIATMLNVETAITASAMFVSSIFDRLVYFIIYNDSVNLLHLSFLSPLRL